MSFNARLGSSNVYRKQPFEKHRRAHPQPSLPQEDAQPNELLSKRNVSGGPPAVRSFAPAPRNPRKRVNRNGAKGHVFSPSNPSASHRGGTYLGYNPNKSRAATSAHTPPGWTGPPHAPRGQIMSSKYSQLAQPVPHLQSAAAVIQDPPVLPPADPDEITYLETERPIFWTSQGNGLTTSAQEQPSASTSSVSNWHPPLKRRKVASRTTPQIPPQPHFSVMDNSMPPDPSVQTSAGPMDDGDSQTNANGASYLPGTSTSTASTSTPSASDLLLEDLGLAPAHSSDPSRLGLPTLSESPQQIPPSVSASGSLISTQSPSEMPSRARNDAAQVMLSSPSVITPQTTTPSNGSPSIKRERSPSPTLVSAARLVTEGCVRIAPLPAACRKPRTNFRAARTLLSTREVKKLRALGLEPTRVFTRDDGMVIDWKSAVPVMSDTLRPPPHLPLEDSPEVTKRGKEPTLSPPSANKSTHGPTPHPPEDYAALCPVSLADTTEIATSVPPTADALTSSATSQRDATDSSAPDPAILPLPHRKRQPPPAVPGTTPDATAPAHELSTSLDETVADENMEAAAIDFLQRYIFTFSADRAALVRAYSHSATFSIQTRSRGVVRPRLHQPTSIAAPAPFSPSDAEAPDTSPGEPSAPLLPRAPLQGRADIIVALLALPDDQTLCSDPPEGDTAACPELPWDLMYAADADDLLVICYAVQTREGAGKGKGRAELWSCEQRFVLRRREWDEEDRSTAGLWPLVAVAHQMTMRPVS